MSEPKTSQAFEDQLRQAVNPPNPSPEFISQVRSQLAAKSQTLSRKKRPSRILNWGWAAALAALFLLLWIASPFGARARQTLLGYIPGIGIVTQDDTFRILAAPTSSENQGVVITVSEGIIDTTQTILLLRVDLPTPIQPESAQAGEPCSTRPSLRMADGSLVEATAEEGRAWETGYFHRVAFPTIPGEQAVLELPCLMHLAGSEWPQGWELPLRFVYAGDHEIAPLVQLPPAPTRVVVEAPSQGGIPTEIAVANPAQEPTHTAAPLTEPTILPEFAHVEISLVIESAADVASGLALFGRVQWESTTGEQINLTPLQFTWQDANGELLPYDYIEPQTHPESGAQWVPWAHQIAGDHFALPLTLTLEEVLLNISLPEPLVFTFDPGPNPQLGQVYELNQSLSYGPYNLQIISAEVQTPNTNLPGQSLRFTMRSSSGVVGASLEDSRHPVMGGGGGGGGMPGEGPFHAEIAYPSAIPQSPIEISVNSITIYQHGRWETGYFPAGY